MRNVINEFDGQFAFLSNFADSPFTVKGITYPTNEHFFQAMKTLDIEERKKIAAAPTPGAAKRMGRQVALRDDWESMKIAYMRVGLREKFTQNPDLACRLVLTGDAELIEGNSWHDNTWGDCGCPKCIGIVGKNYLGKELMVLRSELKDKIEIALSHC